MCSDWSWGTDLCLIHPFQHNVLLLQFQQEIMVQSIGMWLGDNGMECEGCGWRGEHYGGKEPPGDSDWFHFTEEGGGSFVESRLIPTNRS